MVKHLKAKHDYKIKYLQGLDENHHLNCDKCGWPTCEDIKCRTNSNHQGECLLTIARGERVSISSKFCFVQYNHNWILFSHLITHLQVTIKDFIAPHPTYKCLMPLRCLLLKEKNKAKWDKLLELQSNVATIENTKKDKADLEDVPQFIQRFIQVQSYQRTFSQFKNSILFIDFLKQKNGQKKRSKKLWELFKQLRTLPSW